MPRIWKLWRDRGRGETPDQQEQRQRQERADLAADYRLVFAGDAGQRVLADLLRRCGVLNHTYDAHPPNAAYNQGRQSIGLETIELINADPADQLRLALSGQTEELFP